MATTNTFTIAPASDTRGELLEFKSVLSAGGWAADIAIDTTKVLSLTIDPGGANERQVKALLDNPQTVLTRSTTTNTNDTATATLYVSGDDFGHPEHNTSHVGETVNILVCNAGIYADGSGNSSDQSIAGTPVTNNSTNTMPIPIMRVLTPEYQKYVGTFTIEVSCFHIYGIKSVDGVLTDSLLATYNAVQQTSPTVVSRSGSYGPASQYEVWTLTFDITGLAAGAATIDVTVTPNIGSARSTADDSLTFNCVIDPGGALNTRTAYVDEHREIAITGLTGAISKGDRISAGTSGGLAVVWEDHPSNATILKYWTLNPKNHPLVNPETLTIYTGAATGSIDFNGTQPTDGDTITVTDSQSNTVTFEFDNNSTVTPGNTLVTIEGTVKATALSFSRAFENEIDAGSIFISPIVDGPDKATDTSTLTLTSWEYGTGGNVSITTTGTTPPIVTGMSGGSQVTATTNGSPVDGWSATPAFDDPNNPYPGIPHALRDIYLTDGTTEGVTIYIKSGFFNQHGQIDQLFLSPATLPSYWVTITRDPATTSSHLDCVLLESSDVKKYGGDGKLWNKPHLKDVSVYAMTGNGFGVGSNLGIGASDNYPLWLDQVEIYGDGMFHERVKIGGGANVIQNYDGGIWYLGCYFHDFYRIGSLYISGERIFRDVKVANFQGDFFIFNAGQGDTALVNTEWRNLEGRVSGNHADFIQVGNGDGADNVIVDHFRWGEVRYQCAFLSPGAGNTFHRFAFSDGLIEMTDDGDMGTRAFVICGNTGHFDHLLLYDMTIVGGGINFAGGTTAGISQNGSIRNTISDRKTNFDPSASEQPASEVSIVNSHANASDAVAVGIRGTAGDGLSSLFTNPWSVSIWPTPSGLDWTPLESSVIDNRLLSRDMLSNYDLTGNARSVGGPIGVYALGSVPLARPMLSYRERPTIGTRREAYLGGRQ